MIPTPDQRVRVFVSSSLGELAPERVAVRRAIESLHLTPVMFEAGARSHAAERVYRDYLAQSHVFVAIYWESYGWIAPGAEVSGLEDELRLSEGLPRLVYLKEPAPARDERLRDMIARLHRSNVATNTIGGADDLREQLTADLSLLLSERFLVSRPEPPSGTVTFLFTDIEGSSRRWEDDPEEMSRLLARHDSVVRSVIEAEQGFVFKTEGDAFLASFRDPLQAVRAAWRAQQSLHDQDWGVSEPLRIRAALHTGTAEVRDRDYFGPSVNRAARIVSLAHGGQVIMSAATAQLVEEGLPDGAILRDLGSHRLKDLTRPERIFQLAAPGLPASFPPLRSAEWRPHNLPVQMTAFIDRETELAELVALVGTSRLVTISGIGGSGKSRLALRVASAVGPEFPDGTWLVELASVSDPELVPKTVASVLRVTEPPGREPSAALHDHLRDKRLLLLLDNCEHLLEACARFAAAVLFNCPEARVLATSREGLGIPGEQMYPVPSLPFPPEGHAVPSPEEALSFPAVRLFVERLREGRPDFRLEPHVVSSVVEIVRRLDGIPLALELAASRASALSLDRIAERLQDRFRLLTGGRRTMLPRQQTLEAAMDWSHGLLSDAEKVLFRRLSVFAGGWTLEAAEDVTCGELLPRAEILDLLTRLVDKSLVLMTGDDRYRFLETVRQYAVDRLLEAAETRTIRDAHLDWFMRLAEEAALHLHGGTEQISWLDRLEAEHDNLRTALEWSLSSQSADPAQRMASALAWFWYLRGHWQEAEGILRRAASLPGQPMLEGRVKGWHALIALRRGDGEVSRAQAEEALRLLRQTEDREGLAMALLVSAAQAISSHDTNRARNDAMEALEIFRQLDHEWGTALAQILTAQSGIFAGEEGATELVEESVRLMDRTGDKWGHAYGLGLLAYRAFMDGHVDDAAKLSAQSLGLAESVGDASWQVENLILLTKVALIRGDAEAAGRQVAVARSLEDRLKDPHLSWHLAQAEALRLVADGQWDEAEELFSPVVEQVIGLGQGDGMSAFSTSLAEAFASMGSPRLAAALLYQALWVSIQGRRLDRVAGTLRRLDTITGTLDGERAETLMERVESFDEHPSRGELDDLLALARNVTRPHDQHDQDGGAGRR